MKGAAAQLAKVRALCLALPGAHERPSHGSPTFFVGGGKGRSFATFTDNHHGDGIVGVVVAGAPGQQAMLVDTSPAHYYVPPYVGHKGWIGVRLDRGLAWPEAAAVIESAHGYIVGKKR